MRPLGITQFQFHKALCETGGHEEASARILNLKQ